MRSLVVVVERAGDGELAGRARRGSSRRTRRRRRVELGAPARRAWRARLFLFLGRHRRSCRRRSSAATLRGGGLAGALGDLAARFLFLAPRLLRSRAALLGLFLGASSRLFFLGLPARLFLGLALRLLGGARASSSRRRSASAMSGAAARLVVGLAARPATARTRAAALLGGQRARHRDDRRGVGSACAARRRGARLARRAATAARPARPSAGSGAAPGATIALLARPRRRPSSSGHARSSAAPDRSRSACLQLERAAGRAGVKGRFCSWSRHSSLFATAILRPRFRPERTPIHPSAPPLARNPASRRRSTQQSAAERPWPNGDMNDRALARRTPRPARPPVSTVADGRSPAPAPPACRGRPRRRRSASNSSAASPRRTASLTCSNPATASPARRASPSRSQAAPRQQRLDAVRKIRAAPPPAAAPRARTRALPPPAPLYRGAAQPQTPSGQPRRRHRARSRRPGRRRSAAASPRSRGLAGDDAAPLRRRRRRRSPGAGRAQRRRRQRTSILRRRGARRRAIVREPMRARRHDDRVGLVELERRRRPCPTPASISISSSPARSARSSSVLTPFSPSVTSMPGVRPSSAASSSATPSSRRGASYSLVAPLERRRGRAPAARPRCPRRSPRCPRAPRARR